MSQQLAMPSASRCDRYRSYSPLPTRQPSKRNWRGEGNNKRAKGAAWQLGIALRCTASQPIRESHEAVQVQQRSLQTRRH